MNSRPQETMFSLTPPPSEFDEFDKTTLLTCSPSLTGYCYPSPAPSHGAHAPSVSSDSIYIGQEDMSFPEERHHDSQDMFYTEPVDSSFYPIPSVSGPTMHQYASTATYPILHQSQWMPYSTYAQPPPLTSYDQPTTNIYPAFESTIPHSYTNIIPPTPQDIAPANFDFNSTQSMPLQQPQHLSASPAFSQQSSHQSSLSSASRSPSPSAYQAEGIRSSAIKSSHRSNSISSNSSLHAYGIPVNDRSSTTGQPAWRCAYPGCTSRATFTRGCDLRKHYNRHSKHLFCRVDGCPQSQPMAEAKSADGMITGGFSSKKDRARHEAKHNPGIKCEWRGPEGEECGRVFSRMDNMKDHVRRIHKKTPHQDSQ